MSTHFRAFITCLFLCLTTTLTADSESIICVSPRLAFVEISDDQSHIMCYSLGANSLQQLHIDGLNPVFAQDEPFLIYSHVQIDGNLSLYLQNFENVGDMLVLVENQAHLLYELLDTPDGLQILIQAWEDFPSYSGTDYPDYLLYDIEEAELRNLDMVGEFLGYDGNRDEFYLRYFSDIQRVDRLSQVSEAIFDFEMMQSVISPVIILPDERLVYANWCSDVPESQCLFFYDIQTQVVNEYNPLSRDIVTDSMLTIRAPIISPQGEYIALRLSDGLGIYSVEQQQLVFYDAQITAFNYQWLNNRLFVFQIREDSDSQTGLLTDIYIIDYPFTTVQRLTDTSSLKLP